MPSTTQTANIRLPPMPDFPTLVREIDPADAMFDGRLDHYRDVGISALRQVERGLRGLPDPARILDLACGHGRVTRFLRARYPDAAITGCDLDESGIAFVARAFDATALRSAPDFARFDTGARYDLVWIGSLVTHLPELQTRALLDFLDRHLAADGTVVLTSHGSFVARRLVAWHYGLSEDAARGLLADCRMEGYAYRPYPGSHGYGVSLTRREWFEQVIPEGAFRLAAYREQAWDHHQDVVVLRRAERPRWPLGGLRRTQRRYAGHGGEPVAEDRQERLDVGQVSGFDEAWYLRTYPDIATAVRGGVCPSGLRHYQLWGWREGREPGDPAASFAGRAAEAARRSGKNRVDGVWSEDQDDRIESAGWYWMAHPLVRARLNRLASGDPAADAYGRLATILGEHGVGLPIGDVLSLGCGFGALERDLAARQMAERIEGTDIAEGAIREARRRAVEAGLNGIAYRVADLDREPLRRGAYDLVLGHQSVHHVEKLERLFEQVAAALRPNGSLHLHEFVGPTRFQWTDGQLALVNAFLEALPDDLRRLPSGEPKPLQTRPTVEAMIAADPSESIRSAEIPVVLARSFDVIERRDLGGAVLHLALGGIAQNFVPGHAEHEARLHALFAIEDEAMQAGSIGSDFVTILARPRTGLAATADRRP